MITIDQGGAQAKTHHLVAVPPSLRHVLEFAWEARPLASGQNARRWRIVPDDAPHIIFNVESRGSSTTTRLSVVGARSIYEDIDTSHREYTIGIRLRPGMLSSLLGVPAEDLTNRSVSLDALARPSDRWIIERLRNDSLEAAPMHLMALVDALACKADVPDRVRFFDGLSRTGSASVDELAQHVGIGARALRQWSNRTLGIGPKRFLRIRRLHAALELKRTRPHLSWSWIAAHAGFADQSHLVRDSQELLGESPGIFMTRGGR